MLRLTALLFTSFFIISLVSCKSEYAERLGQGLELKAQLTDMENSMNVYTEDLMRIEMESIRNEINLLAKVSGNEELFLSQLFED